MTGLRVWLSSDRVYRVVMNVSLWAVFSATVVTTKWPVFTWILWVIAVVALAGDAVVYWLAVVSRAESKRQ